MANSNNYSAPLRSLVVDIPVCVFAKPPVPGKVKTRLAYLIGSQAAAALASAMLCDVWSTIQSVAGVTPVLAASEAGSFPLDVPDHSVWLQEPGDLGWRIECILRRALLNAPAAIALAADSPLLMPGLLVKALDQLASHDAVLGPSEDGGFYLLGLRSCPPDLLAGIAWSCQDTFRQTRERLSSCGFTPGFLPSLLDVDTPADMRSLVDYIDRAPAGGATHTRACFREHAWSASSFQL